MGQSSAVPVHFKQQVKQRVDVQQHEYVGLSDIFYGKYLQRSMKVKCYLCFASAGADTELKLIIVQKEKLG